MKIGIKFIGNDFIITFGENEYRFRHDDYPYMDPEIIKYNMTGMVDEFNRMDNDAIYKKIEKGLPMFVYGTFGVPRCVPYKIKDFRLFNEFVFSKYFELFDYYVYDAKSETPILDAYSKMLEIINTILKSGCDDEEV